jgi:hypothetical protein
MEGSIRSGAALAHALWLAQGSPASVTMEGQTITMTLGYPNVATIVNTLSDTTGFDTSTPGVFAKVGAPGTCEITYAAATAPSNIPTIGRDLSGC